MLVEIDKVREIFLEVLKAPPEQRAAQLDAACAGNEDARPQVERLLRAHQELGSVAEGGTPGATRLHSTDAFGAGAVIGPYKLLEQIGEGGFGVVFMAEQTEPVRRKVALKVLKPGMDTKQVIARFEAERQALAIMDHPNIARVFDGGTTPPAHAGGSQRPYFVMELVRGTPITEFCDENHLDIRERLALFLNVCQAVQHAHQKGIIHRDLKPSNIMIASHDGTPVVKVIDFGIAKTLSGNLTDKTLFTGFAQMIGTPLYMSPEQAGQSNLDVDTRSDIYSLGVLLYELLTSVTPFGKEQLGKLGYDELRRIIREEEPPRPSARVTTLGQAATTASANRKCDPRTLSRQICGELDWIVMKALEKDRNRRYETSSALAADVQRYLNDEAVQACSPSAWYRVRKLLRRNRGSVLAAGLMSATLVVTIGVLAVSNFRIDQALKDRTQALEERGLAYGELQVQQQKVTQALDDVTKLLRQVQTEQLQTRQALYFHSIALADREWWLNNVDKAEEILDACSPEHRDWEWHFLKRRCRSGTIVYRHIGSGGASAVAISPDGKSLACCLVGSQMQGIATWGVKIWEIGNGTELAHVRIPVGNVAKFAFSPDGRHLAIPRIVGAQAHVQLLDPKTGAEVRRIATPGATARAVAYSPNGEQVAVVGNAATIMVFDLATGVICSTLKGHTREIFSFAYSPDGKRLATAGSDKTARVWDVASGRELFTLEGHAATVYDVAYSPDGQRLATASVDGWRTYDAQTGKRLLTLPVEPDQEVSDFQARHNVAFSPDSQRMLVMGQDRTLRVLDVDTATELLRLRGHNAHVYQVGWSRAGRLVSLSQDGTLRSWPATSSIRLSMNPTAHYLAISPDGKTMAGIIASKTSETLTYWDIPSGQVKARLGEAWPVVQLKISPDNQTFAATFRFGLERFMLKVCDAATAREMVTLRNDRRPPLSYCFRGDGKRLAAAHGRNLLCWNLPSGNEVFSIPTGDVTTIAYSPDGKFLGGIELLSPKEHLLKLWDAATGKQIRAWRFGGRYGTVAFSSDGELLADGGSDNLVRICRVGEDRALQILPTSAGGLAFPWKSKRLATWGAAEKALKIWDPVTGRELLTLRGHDKGVSFVAFSPEGMLTSTDIRGNVRLFDGRPWEAPAAAADRASTKD